LTCDFWAENAKNKCKCNKQKQIPCGDDNKKGKGKTTAKARWPSRGLRPTLRKVREGWGTRFVVAGLKTKTLLWLVIRQTTDD
jgi:hypothetical protein